MRAAPLLLVAGCAGAPDGTAPDDPVPYVLPEQDAPSADVDLEALTPAVQAAFDAALTLHATPVLQAYQAAVTDHDDACPPVWTQTESALQWYGTCSTAAGTAYAGYAIYQEGTTYDQGFDGTYAYLYGASTLRTADGHTFVIGGSATLARGTQDGATVGQSSVSGTFSWDGPGAAGTWLGDGTQLDLVTGWQHADWGRYLFLDGAVVPATGEAVHFGQVVVLDVYCPNEPGGTVSVRGPDGWVDVHFDLDTEHLDQLTPAQCDGCGTAWYRGVEVGRLCVDVDGLASFGDAPW
jgi:hypothetical protein